MLRFPEVVAPQLPFLDTLQNRQQSLRPTLDELAKAEAALLGQINHIKNHPAPPFIGDRARKLARIQQPSSDEEDDDDDDDDLGGPRMVSPQQQLVVEHDDILEDLGDDHESDDMVQ